MPKNAYLYLIARERADGGPPYLLKRIRVPSFPYSFTMGQADVGKMFGDGIVLAPGQKGAADIIRVFSYVFDGKHELLEFGFIRWRIHQLNRLAGSSSGGITRHLVWSSVRPLSSPAGRCRCQDRLW